MTGLKIVNLFDMLEELEESKVKQILSSFSCPLNLDVENYLKSTAIVFAKQRIAATHLIFAPYKGKPVLAGYFTIAIKTMYITKRSKLSSNLRRRLNKFATYNSELARHEIAAPLIAQLGKNYANGYNTILTGDELLEFACRKVALIQQAGGGKVVYLECEDKPKLIEFYNSNGFYEFDRRPKDKDETGIDGDYLIQMLKYM